MKVRVYYGWWLVAMAAVTYAVVAGTTAGAFGVFVVPVAGELKLSRAQMNTALIFQNIGNAALAPFIGRLLDRMRPKPVMIASSVMFAVSFILLGVSHQIWLSALVMAVGVPAGYLGAGSISNSVLIARWFRTQRARAMLLGGTGMPLGAMIVPPLASLLITAQGWRSALITMGLGMGALFASRLSRRAVCWMGLTPFASGWDRTH